MAEPVLYQFRYSHYNEKVRWALDYKGVPHVRRALLPGPHMLPTLWLTRQRQVPALRLDGRGIADSTAIIAALEARYPERPLYPADPAARRRALELEEFFDEEIGPHLRRAWFHAVLPFTDYAVAQLAVGWGATTQRVYRWLFPVLRAIMWRDMRLDAASAAASRARVSAALDRLTAEVGTSGYLVGDAFSIADLTAAALLSPAVMPAEFPYPLVQELPAPGAAYRASLAGHPSFAWARDIYRRHRGTSCAVRG